MQQGSDDLRREIDRLRDWRHETAPIVRSLEHLYPGLAERVARIEADVLNMREQDRIAAAVASNITNRRKTLLTRGEKVLMVALAAPGVILTVLAIVERTGV